MDGYKHESRLIASFWEIESTWLFRAAKSEVWLSNEQGHLKLMQWALRIRAAGYVGEFYDTIE